MRLSWRGKRGGGGGDHAAALGPVVGLEGAHRDLRVPVARHRPLVDVGAALDQVLPPPPRRHSVRSMSAARQTMAWSGTCSVFGLLRVCFLAGITFVCSKSLGAD